jgi:hypothetical protein
MSEEIFKFLGHDVKVMRDSHGFITVYLDGRPRFMRHSKTHSLKGAVREARKLLATKITEMK